MEEATTLPTAAEEAAPHAPTPTVLPSPQEPTVVAGGATTEKKAAPTEGGPSTSASAEADEVKPKRANARGGKKAQTPPATTPPTGESQAGKKRATARKGASA